jgi:hypothetical protein
MDRTLVIRFDARTLIVVGAVLVILAAWLPWYNLPAFLVGDLARRGWDGGGLLTVALAMLAILSFLLPWRPFERVSVLAAALAVLINLIALVAFARVIQLSTTMEIDLGAQLSSVGGGLYMTFAGAWLMLFGGLANGSSSAIWTWHRTWMGYAMWGGLLTLVLSACLCAWSVGILLRPVTLASSAKPVATFGPAPTGYLATPLVDVQLEPLGPGQPQAVPSRPATSTVPVAPLTTAVPTARRTTPTTTSTRPPTATVSPSATPVKTATPTAFISPIQTPTTAPTATVTPSATVTASPTATPTITATGTVTGTVTP